MKIDLTKIPVFYINMDKDVHKRKNIESRLNQLGFTNVTRISAIEDKKNGRVGLSKSQHIALQQVEAPFIIFEDDAEPKYFTSIINVPDDADAVYLGNSQWALLQSYTGFYLKYEPVKEYKGVYRVYNMLASHAILYLNQDYVRVCQRTTKYCAEKYPMPMDVPFAMIQRFYNIYTIDKPLFIQREYDERMTNAHKFTNKQMTSYKRYDQVQKHKGNFYQDDII